MKERTPPRLLKDHRRGMSGVLPLIPKLPELLWFSHHNQIPASSSTIGYYTVSHQDLKMSRWLLFMLPIRG